MQELKEQSDYLSNLIRSCEYYDLTEKQSMELINKGLSTQISRSTYYNYKKRLYQDEKFQSLRKSVYNSKLLKCLMLYFDERSEPDGFNIDKPISEQFPDRQNIFETTKEQNEQILKVNKKIRSNFCLPEEDIKSSNSNLTRVNQLPKNYTLREEYIRCGKEKTYKCKSCRHGPYYYAYWREKLPEQNKSILRKKYLGTIDPRL
ncbi:MAG: hypothetical protein L0H53_16795 [Candidatus Nitrosocosmicus sp.]|nr:hypothetical protein [Candidatus Nitrosocosmicus sp.]MDN5868036.1 hypothetical protein [Candidatus Nitrosocosmicus sp.]